MKTIGLLLLVLSGCAETPLPPAQPPKVVYVADHSNDDVKSPFRDNNTAAKTYSTLSDTEFNQHFFIKAELDYTIVGRVVQSLCEDSVVLQRISSNSTDPNKVGHAYLFEKAKWTMLKEHNADGYLTIAANYFTLNGVGGDKECVDVYALLYQLKKREPSQVIVNESLLDPLPSKHK